MTIDELKSNLKKINSALKLDVDLDDQPMGVWYESDDSSEDDLELFRIDENDFYFEPIINEIYEANSLIGSDTVKEVGDLLFKYFEPELSKESQKISNDSQKKPKAQLIYDFIDEIADHGFDTEQLEKARKEEMELFEKARKESNKYDLHLDPEKMLKERVNWLEAENKRLEQTNDRLVERNHDLTRTLKIMMEIKSDK